jgi:hypothetical protein
VGRCEGKGKIEDDEDRAMTGKGDFKGKNDEEDGEGLRTGAMRWRTRPTATASCAGQTVLKAEKMGDFIRIVTRLKRARAKMRRRMSQGNDDEEDKGERNERIRGAMRRRTRSTFAMTSCMGRQ